MDYAGDPSFRRRTIDEPDRAGPGDLAHSVARLASLGVAPPEDARAHAFIPIWRGDRLAVAAFDKGGATLAATQGFPLTDRAEVVRAIAGNRGTTKIRAAATTDGANCLFAVVDVETARGWSLTEHGRRVVETRQAAAIGLSVAMMRSEEAVREASAHLGLSPLQAGLAAALARHGDLARAARESGVAYSTAREALAEAMARVGVKKRAALIDRVVGLSFGVAAEGELGRDVLRDSWGMTYRQMHIAAAIAAGATREEAAASASVSPAVAKKELAAVFLTLGVASGTALSALMAEAGALAMLIAASGGDVSAPADRIEPTSLTPRPSARGMIAYSDYGPKGGAPTLVLHSSSASRPAPTRLVETLQASGFRPFSIDRPGFGLTDWNGAPGDPFANACEDIRSVCRKLRFDRINVVARGGAQAALHLAAQSPELVGAVVLVAPDPPTRISRPTTGVLGAVKHAFQSNPALIEPLARLLVSNLRASSVRDLMLKTVASSAADLAVMDDPQNVADYCRGFRMFLAGRIKGYVHEQSALVTEPDPPSLPVARWDVLIGEQDPLHDPEETARYFGGLLPAARIRMLPDAGRFVVMSHARLIAVLLGKQNA